MKVKPAERLNAVQEYYFAAKLRQIDRMRSSGIDVINLGIGNPDQSPSENTIRQLCSEASKPGIHGYQSYAGIPGLRKAFAEWYLKYFKVLLDPDSQILPLMGSKEGIMHITMAYIGEGDAVLVPNPGYPVYASAAKLAGGKVKYYDLTEKSGWQPDISRIEDSDLSGVKLMWVNYPNMPTGTPASANMFDKLVGFASRHNILLCNDNPYSFILNKDYKSILASQGAMDIALELNSLSKSHNMAGWRIGMLAGNREYIQNILKFKSNMDSGMFYALQMAAVEALNNPPEWHDRINIVYRKRRIIAEEIMDILGCRYDRSQTGLFLWGKVPEMISNTESFVEELLTGTGVFITPGFIFGSNGDGYIRISLCADESKLLEAKNRLASYLSPAGPASGKIH